MGKVVDLKVVEHEPVEKTLERVKGWKSVVIIGENEEGYIDIESCSPCELWQNYMLDVAKRYLTEPDD